MSTTINPTVHHQPITLRETITPKTEKWIRISAVMAMLIVASSSAILSFDGLQKVALASRVPEHLAFLFPIAVDTTILMGSLAVLLYELVGVRSIFGWFTVLFGTVLSVTGNVISVSDAGLIAQVLHGIIPVLLCISLESLLRILRFNIQRSNKALAEYEKGTQNNEEVEENGTTITEVNPDITETSSVAVETQKPVAMTIETPNPATTISPSPSLPSYIASQKPSESQEKELNAESSVITENVLPNISQESPKTAETLEPVILSETLAEPVVESADVPVAVESKASTTVPATEEISPSGEVSDKIESAEEDPESKPEPKKPVRRTPAKRTAPKNPAAKATASTSTAKRSAPKKPTAKTEADATPTSVPAKEPVKASPPLVPENVEKYKIFLEGLPDGLDRNQKAREIKKIFPSATVTDIKAAFRG